MWGSVLLVIIVLGLAFSGGENNYLNPSGNRNPANQKLMVVDQDSGEISFIQKSLQGVNTQIATDDSVISDAVAKLRTDVDSILADLNDFKTPQLTTDSGNTQRTMKDLRDKLDNALKHGEGVQILYKIPGSTAGHGLFRLGQTCNSYGMANNNPAKWAKRYDCKQKPGTLSIRKFHDNFQTTVHDNAG